MGGKQINKLILMLQNSRSVSFKAILAHSIVWSDTKTMIKLLEGLYFQNVQEMVKCNDGNQLCVEVIFN